MMLHVRKGALLNQAPQLPFAHLEIGAGPPERVLPSDE
jgi:hypothetical protein